MLRAGSMAAPDPDRKAPALPDRHSKTHFGHKQPEALKSVKLDGRTLASARSRQQRPRPSLRAFITSTFQRGSCPNSDFNKCPLMSSLVQITVNFKAGISRVNTLSRWWSRHKPLLRL